ncbi:MAG: DUF3592 domain-containing protein [Pseudomonadota bacterium]
MIRRFIRFWAWLFMLAGLYMVYSGFSAIGGSLGSWLFDESAEGKVIGHDVSQTQGLKARTLIAPIVQFTTEQGQHLTFTDRVQSTSGEPRVGERVSVHYDPDQPEQATIATSTFWTGGAGILGIGFGLVLSLMGLLVLLMAKLPWQQAKPSSTD